MGLLDNLLGYAMPGGAGSTAKPIGMALLGLLAANPPGAAASPPTDPPTTRRAASCRNGPRTFRPSSSPGS